MNRRLLLAFLSTAILITTIGLAARFYAMALSSSSADSLATKSTPVSSPMLGKEFPGLPGYCKDKLISASGCDGMTEITSEQGNTYRLVEIGNQCWFADNLKEVPSTDQGWYGYYDNADQETSPGEGMLYTWDAAMDGNAGERSQGVCPDGWHIPSSCEFAINDQGSYNFKATGMYNLSRNSFDWRGEIANHWSSSTNEDTLIYHLSSNKYGSSLISNPYINTTTLNNSFSTSCLLN